MNRFGFSILTALAIVAIVDGATAQQPIALVHQPEEIPPGSFSESSVTGGDASGSSSCCECCGGGGCDSGYCMCRCQEVCCPRIEEATEKRSCWVVKCEKACVPAVRFPWEPGGAKLTLFSWFNRHSRSEQRGDMCDGLGSASHGSHDRDSYPTKCGYVRCVRVLELEEYEVTTTKCQWEMRRLPSCAAPAGER